MVNMVNAIKAPARLTMDSNASENRPTEPVSKYAPDFSPKVRTAAAIDSQAKRVREGWSLMNDVMMLGNYYGTMPMKRTQVFETPATH